jgi:hypothetical protein
MMPFRPGVSVEEIWGYVTRELTKYSKVYKLVDRFGKDEYTTYVSVSNASTTVLSGYLAYTENPVGIFIPCTGLNLTKLYAVVNYYLKTYGTAKMYFGYGADTVLIDDISAEAAGTSKVSSVFVDLSPYLKDDRLVVMCDLAGDGTNASEARLYHITVFGVSE